MSRHYRYENGKLVLKAEHEMMPVDPSTLPPALVARIRQRMPVDPSTLPPALVARIRQRMTEAEKDFRELAARQARRRKSA